MWRIWLILAIAIVAGGLSFTLALQHRYFEGVVRQGSALEFASVGQTAQQVVSLRRTQDTHVFEFTPADLTLQAESFGSFNEWDLYLKRQDEIVKIMDSPTVILGFKQTSGQIAETPVRVLKLRLSMLGEGFWGPFIVGLAAFLIGGWVWCLKPDEMVTQALAINGLGMLIASTAGSIGYAQPVAGPSELASAILHINHLGTAIFGVSLVSLFLVFPKPLISTRAFWAILASSLIVSALDYSRLMGSPEAILIFCFAVMAFVTILIGVQCYASRNDPNARASLLWLGLAVFVGTGLWCLMIATYQLQGQMHNMPGSYVFVSFLIMYIGIAVGVARFRLFEVGDWAFRIFFYAVAAFLFIGLDAGLIYLVGLNQSAALTVALLIIGFGYLPLRDVLWRRFLRRKSLSDSEMLGSVLDMAFAPEPALRQVKWQGLLQTLFAPQRIATATARVDMAYIEADGLHLYVPSVMEAPALKLSFPHGGRGLFSPKNLDLLNQIIRLAHKAMHGLSAYERGAAEQRQRLAQNLHDDVGAKLVSGLNVADAASRPFIYEALTEIRDIASAMTTESAPLERVVADMRHETVRRLDAAQIDLDWPLWPEDAPFVQITATQKKALTSVMREAITNCIKHAQATQLVVNLKLTKDILECRIEDNGKGFPANAMDGSAIGQGLRSMADRLAQSNGRLRFKNAHNEPGGAIVEFDFPLPANNLKPQGTTP